MKRLLRTALIRLGIAAFGIALFLFLSLRPSYPWITLSSGHKVRLLAIEQYSVAADSSIVLQFRYETRVPLEDTLDLRLEAISLWPTVRRRVEKAGYSRVAFRAQERPMMGAWCWAWAGTGLCMYRHYGFLFEKRADGRWYLFTGAGEWSQIGAMHSSERHPV